MKTQASSGLIMWTGTGLLILALSTGVRAADTADTAATVETVETVDVTSLVDTCTHCHERDGASYDPNMPIIGGYSAPYIVSSLTAYKKEARPCPEIEYISNDKAMMRTNMCRISQSLSEEDINHLAQYYAGKKFRRANQDYDPELARLGKIIHARDCEKCHSDGGSNAADDAGILAGQWVPYLKQQFFAFYAEKRQLNKKMTPKFNKLDKTEMEALLNYYASRGAVCP